MARYALFLVLFACGDARQPVLADEAELTTGEWPPAPPAIAVDPEAPIDPREVLMHLERHAGQERLCDLTFLGETEPQGRGVRRLIRCLSAMGAGWADLHFAPEATELNTFLRMGERIRVRVAQQAGFGGHVRFEYLATVGQVEAREPAERGVKMATNWDAVAAAQDFDVRRCAVSYTGQIRPSEEEEFSHSARVLCNSRAGEHWVEMLFPEVTHNSALRVVRGEVVAARLLETPADGPAYPRVRYEGP